MANIKDILWAGYSCTTGNKKKVTGEVKASLSPKNFACGILDAPSEVGYSSSSMSKALGILVNEPDRYCISKALIDSEPYIVAVVGKDYCSYNCNSGKVSYPKRKDIVKGTDTTLENMLMIGVTLNSNTPMSEELQNLLSSGTAATGVDFEQVGRELAAELLVRTEASSLPKEQKLKVELGSIKKIELGEVEADPQLTIGNKALLSSGKEPVVTISSTNSTFGVTMASFPKVEGYVAPDFVETIIGIVCNSYGSVMPCSNLLFYGAAGTGKTQAGEYIASKLKKSFAAYTLSPDTTKETLFGGVMPLLGQEKLGYKMVVPEFIKVMTEGGVVVLDEITNANPQCLKALNGFIMGQTEELADGTPVTRHPDSIVVCTTNAGEGYVADGRLDQSFTDRMHLIWKFEALTASDMVKFTMSKLNLSEDKREVLTYMASKVVAIRTAFEGLEINTACLGLRTLLSWASATFASSNSIAMADSMARFTIANKVAIEDPEGAEVARQILFGE